MILDSIARRVARALMTCPGLRDYVELAIAACLFCAVAAPVALVGGLIHWSPLAAGQLAPLAGRALFIPAIGEELAFRAALVPSREPHDRPAIPIGTSVVLFTLWHVVETTFLPGSAATFLRMDFLALAACLGFACALLRYRSGSLWTAVALHWAVVVAWQGLLGGPRLGVPTHS
jgi:predicted Abi (CAAX) family protease